MKLLCLIVLAALPLAGLARESRVLETDDIALIAKVLESADAKTLVVFDIDETIVMPDSESRVDGPIRRELREIYGEGLSQEVYTDCASAIYLKRSVGLIDGRMLEILADLKNRKVGTIALTSWHTGRMGQVEAMEDLRFRDLDSVGVSFEATSVFPGDAVYPDIMGTFGPAMLIKGVLLTSDTPKGPVLCRAIEDAGLAGKYAKVVFIDDLPKNIASVQEACAQMGVDYEGVLFTAYQKIPCQELERAEENQRFQILVNERAWLRDAELRERISAEIGGLAGMNSGTLLTPNG